MTERTAYDEQETLLLEPQRNRLDVAPDVED
jgi:hypothetical protein